MTGRIGILGGLGPLASAEFLKTIYECNLGAVEQDAPIVVLYSDPSFPDRTEAFLSGREEILLAQFAGALEQIRALGATKTIICCVTIHHLLPRLPSHLRDNVVSLIDVTLAALARSERRSLMLCTNGTRTMRIFERHQGWAAVEDRVVWPNAADQQAVHDILYLLKQNESPALLFPRVRALLSAYHVDSFVAGCTEGHLLTKHLLQRERDDAEYGVVDPLLILARDVKRLAHE